MKRSSLLTALAATWLLSAPIVFAGDNDWRNSYQLEAEGKYSEAIAAIDPIPANGADAELKLLRRGWLFYLSGSFNESIREYRLAIERNQQSLDAHLGVTLPLLAQKRWREAELSARAALELAPNHYTALLRLALAQEGQRDWSKMAKTATTLITSYPSDATAYVYLARARAWLEQRNEAVAAYQAVLSRYPGHLEAEAYLNQQ